MADVWPDGQDQDVIESVMTNRLERSAGRSVGVAMTTLPVTTSRGNVRGNVKMVGLATFAIKLAQKTTLDRSVNSSVEIAKMVTYVTT